MQKSNNCILFLSFYRLIRVTNMKLLYLWMFACLLCLTPTLSAYTNQNHEVQVLPFFALAEIPKTLHLVDDQFRLIQHIDLKPLIVHIHDIGLEFSKVKLKYMAINGTVETDVQDYELKLTALLQQLAETIDAGVQLLPHNTACLKREKRSLDNQIDVEVVNTHPLFPSVGRLFSWVTGSLSNEAGKIINQNFNNIKRLTQASAKFAQMFNSTLKIQIKHKKQIIELKNQISNIEHRFMKDLSILG